MLTLWRFLINNQGLFYTSERAYTSLLVNSSTMKSGRIWTSNKTFKLWKKKDLSYSQLSKWTFFWMEKHLWVRLWILNKISHIQQKWTNANSSTSAKYNGHNIIAVSDNSEKMFAKNTSRYKCDCLKLTKHLFDI